MRIDGLDLEELLPGDILFGPLSVNEPVACTPFIIAARRCRITYGQRTWDVVMMWGTGAIERRSITAGGIHYIQRPDGVE